MLPGYIGYIIFFSSLKPTTDPYTGVTTFSGPTSGGVAALVISLAFLIGFELWQLYEQGTTGQTIGKRALNIRVIREADGRYTGFGGAFLRALAHILDGLPVYIGYFAPLWDAKNQTFADKVCHTVVVQG